MKYKKSRLGLSILAGGLSFVGAANATDLLTNGSFETSYDSPDGGWQFFTQYNSSTQAYYDGPAIPASENPGTYYSACQSMADTDWGHFTTPNSWDYMFSFAFEYAASQRVDLTTAVSPADIQAGLGQYTFSAWLASFNGNVEQPCVYLQFFSNATGAPAPSDWISTPAVFDRTTNTYAVAFANTNNWYDPGSGTNIPLDLSSDHQWIKYVATGNIPTNALQATVFLTRSPNEGLDNSPDTYMDLVKVDVTGPTVIAPTITTPPTNQTAAVGNSISFSVMASGTDLAYQWRHSATNLPGRTDSTLVLSPVQITDAGSYDVVLTNSGGAFTSSPPVTLTVINPQVFVTGQWDFLLGDLTASYGANLQCFDGGVQGDTTFGTTTSFGISDINGTPTPVMHFIPSVWQWGGYVMTHGAAPNGGGDYVNQYTLIYDIYFPASADETWRSLWQTDEYNDQDNDGDLFVSTSDSIGIGAGGYSGYVSPDAWHRLAFAFDLTGTETGTAPTPLLTKFIDGVKVGNQILPSGMDGRWALDPTALLFASDGDDEDVAPEAYVSSVQFSNGRRPDAFIEALGGPSALKIPGTIKAGLGNGAVTITWSGGVPLQSADSLTGTWSTVSGTGSGTANPSSYTPSPLSTAKFYRPQIP
jgi:hypothetical protein